MLKTFKKLVVIVEIKSFVQISTYRKVQRFALSI